MRRLFGRYKVLRQPPFHDFKAFADLNQDNSFTLARQVHDPAKTYDLIAFPAEENFAGAKANLNLVKYFETNHSAISEAFPNYEGQHQSFVVLDMAAYVPTNPINLTEVAPAFAVGSFYKMFGFPTGVGFLIVRHDVSHLLIKKYFGGGSLVMAAVGTDFVQFRERPDTRFEDGTQNFYGIAGVAKGLKAISKMGGIQLIQQHVGHLRELCVQQMKELKYSNGQDLLQLYEINGSPHGGIIAFNLFFANGTIQGYKAPLTRAVQYNLQIRAGSMCNPGAIQFYIGVSDQVIIHSTASRLSCSDDLDIFNGKVLGALRVSFGWGSTYDDIEQLLNWLKSEIK